MRKVGTISIALSFIFIGVTLLISKFDSQLAYSIFKFWPVIFIALGLEFIIPAVMDKEEIGVPKRKINLWIILIIIIFLGMDGVWSFTKTNFAEDIKNGSFVRDLKRSIKDGVNIDFGNDYEDGEVKEFNLLLENNINELALDVANADVRIEKAKDGKVGFEGKVTLKEGTSLEPKDALNTSGNKATLNLKRNEVKKLKVTIFVKDDSKLALDVSNGRIVGKDEFKGVALNSRTSNAAYDLEGFKILNLENTNGEIKVRKGEEVVFSNVNGSVDIREVEKIKGTNKNGKIDVDTDKVKDIYLENNLGEIRFKTKEADIDLKADVKTGKLSYNSNTISKGSNTKSFAKILGAGDKKVTLINNLGSIDIQCKE